MTTVRANRAGGRFDRGDPIVLGDDPGRVDAGQQGGPGAPGGRRIAEGQPGWVGQAVLGAERRPDEVAEVELGHELGDIRRAEQPDVDTETALHLGRGPVRGPRIRISDQEQVAILDDVERQPMRRAEARDQGMLASDSSTLIRLENWCRKPPAQRPVEPVPRAVSRSTRTTGRRRRQRGGRRH